MIPVFFVRMLMADKARVTMKMGFLDSHGKMAPSIWQAETYATYPDAEHAIEVTMSEADKGFSPIAYYYQIEKYYL